MAEVESTVDQFVRQRVEQRRIAGRVGGAEIVDRIDDPAAHQVKPDPVRLDPAEPGILRRGAKICIIPI